MGRISLAIRRLALLRESSSSSGILVRFPSAVLQAPDHILSPGSKAACKKNFWTHNVLTPKNNGSLPTILCKDVRSFRWCLTARPSWVALPPSENRTVPSRSFSVSSTTHSPALDTDGSRGPPKVPIEKILIANRGEIACRVIQTARRLGIKTVAVFSDADKHSKHIKMADEAVHIGPAPATLSYLSGPNILAAALATNAHAIHPGYGFLSENVKFAELCKEQGINFLGPPSSAIHAMGDKSVAKKLMSEAGVPVVPGYHGDDQSVELLRDEANRIGYPVLIKATQGGGGKGMRIVQSESEFLESLSSAQREALAAFGNSQVLIEKYLSRPRHIEVQIFGDKHGNVVHLFERDCSVQRRHQKIIEEAPAPGVTKEFREEIGQAAVNAAKAVGYESAGTVEFIVDTESGKFYFMEMNTRLQVEHPVTEMVTGQDLVEWQIRVANGERLPLLQDQLKLSGHAFEARIYAENVPRNFLPAAGTLHHYYPPPVSQTVRVETGVGEGDSVSVFYDPMISKLVTWGYNRSSALGKLQNCLSKFQVAGLPTNISFLKTLAKHPAFVAGEVETHFIDNFKSDLLPTIPDSGSELKGPLLVTSRDARAARQGAAIAAVGMCLAANSVPEGLWSGSRSGWSAPTGFRLNHHYSCPIHLEWKSDTLENVSIPIDLSATYHKDATFKVKAIKYLVRDKKTWWSQVELVRSILDTVAALHIFHQVFAEEPLELTITRQTMDEGHRNFQLDVDGLSTTVSLAQYFQGGVNNVHLWKEDQHYHYTIPGQSFLSEESNEEQGSNKAHGRSHSSIPAGAVTAPMSGRVVKVFVENGAHVKRGDSLVVLEAMKMEHVVRAPVEGLVEKSNVVVGQQVSDNSILLQIKSPGD